MRQASPEVVAQCLAMVAPAEAAFTSRWRLTSLDRVDAELHQLLQEQIDLYSTALITAPADELQEQSGAMVRGWRAACSRMEQAPHDAYLVGLDWATKTRVVISDSKQSVAHVTSDDGCRLVAVTPDEVAKLVGSIGMVVLAKQAFPDAEIVDVRQRELA